MSSAPTPRQKRRAKRLRSIKDAALDLVIEDGVDQFSIHKLADRVDLTPGALYRYFDSRDEILVTVQLEVLDAFDHYLTEVAAALETAGPLERIVALCRAYVALEKLQPERFRLIAHLVAAPEPVFEDDVAQPALQKTFAILGKLVLLLQQAADENLLEAGDAQRRAFITWSSLQGLVDRGKLLRFAPENFGGTTLTDELIRTLLIGWGAAPAIVDELMESTTLDMDTLAAALPKE